MLGSHTAPALYLGMTLFIVSEAMFFVGLLWAILPLARLPLCWGPSAAAAPNTQQQQWRQQLAPAAGRRSREEEEQAGKAWGGMGHIGVVVQQQGQGQLTWVAWSTCLHVYPVLVLGCLWFTHC